MTLVIQSTQPGVIAENIDLSVVLPAYNEADYIDQVIKRLVGVVSELTNKYEIIIVDDGSRDGTFERMKSLAVLNKSIVLIRNSSNLGKGAAVRAAASVVRGNVVIMLDSDMDIVPSTLKEYVEILKKYDLCIASKRHPQSSYSAPIVRKFLGIAFNKLVRLMTGVKSSDSQTGLKAMKGVYFRKIMRIISVKRYAYDVEILAVAHLMKLRIAELPVKIEQKSRFSLRAIVYMMIDLLGISYRLRIKEWYQKNLENPDPNYKPILSI